MTDATPRLRSVFATPPLRRLLLAAATARVVEVAMLVALSVHLFERGGAGAVALYGTVQFGAAAIGTTPMTAAAGRARGGRGIAACLAVVALGSVALAVLVAATGPVPLLLAAAAVTAVALGAVRPTVTSVVPDHLRDAAALVATNTAAATVDATSIVVGPFLAGALLAGVGDAAVLWVTASLSAVAAGTLLRLDGSATEHEPPPGVLAGIGGGVRALLGVRELRLAATTLWAQTLVRGALNVTVVGLAIDRLGLGEQGVGLLLGAPGIGGLLGLPLATRTIGRGRGGGATAAGLALWGLPLVVAGLVGGTPVVLTMFAIVGVGNLLIDVGTDTLFQRFAPPGTAAGVIGLTDAGISASVAVGSALAGVLVGVIGDGPTLAVFGLLLPLLACVLWPALRRLDDRLGGRDADVALLQLNGIFSPLVLSAVDRVAQRATTVTHRPGEVVFREGEVGDRVYVVEEGRVEVRRDGEPVATLGPGECFGEVALLDDRPRNATVLALGDLRTRSLARDDFLQVVRSDGGSREAAEQMAAGRRPERSGES